VSGSLSSGASMYFGRDNLLTFNGLQGGLDEITLYHQAVSGSLSTSSSVNL
jgi:hypothetical protein